MKGIRRYFSLENLRLALLGIGGRRTSHSEGRDVASAGHETDREGKDRRRKQRLVKGYKQESFVRLDLAT